MRKAPYECSKCRKVTVLRFPWTYRPFRRWLMSCRRRGRYGVHRTTLRFEAVRTWR
jgi:hypothetical protein